MLTPFWQVIEPHLPGELIDSHAVRLLKAASSALSNEPHVGFECRLSADDRQVDFIQKIRASRFSSQIEAGNRAHGSTDRPHWLEQLNRLQQLPELMRTPFLDLYQEYDLPTHALELPDPSPFLVFSGPHEEFNTQARLTVMKHLAKSMGGLAGHSGLASMVDHIERVLPPGLEVGSFGFMLSRDPLAIRINLGVADFNNLINFLKVAPVDAIPESLEHACRTASRYADGYFVAVDFSITEQAVSLSGRIGLELVFRRQRDSIAIPVFLDWLRENGLCSDSKHEALGNLHKRISPIDTECQWPDDMVVESILSPIHSFSTVAAYISHFKLVCCGAEPMQAKAYLAYRHELVNVDSRQ